MARYKIWSNKEDDIVRAVFHEHGPEATAKALEKAGYLRSLGAVATHANKLGIVRRKPDKELKNAAVVSGEFTVLGLLRVFDASCIAIDTNNEQMSQALDGARNVAKEFERLAAKQRQVIVELRSKLGPQHVKKG